jgi:hypothetical protein
VSIRFGEQSQHFRKHLRVLYSLFYESMTKKETHVETLYNQWDSVFGKVYGDIDPITTEIMDELSKKYGEDIDFAKYGGINLKYIVFVIHTYYNIILKLLVSELFSSLLNPFSTQQIVLTLPDKKFKEYIIKTIKGEQFQTIGVANFFETGFFEWWHFVWTDQLSEMLREVINLLEQLEVTTSITKPELIGDMVKHTYHELMPKELRHLLGEYFTADWLAEYAINIAGFQGTLKETYLDPACGSGTFLTVAIRKKIRMNSDRDNGISRSELVENILHTIVGFDLNPISVIASKTNYLLSLGDLTEFEFTIKIPVYQCDSILTPAVHAKQEEAKSTFNIDTICGQFNVPALDSRDAVEELLDTIQRAINNNFETSTLLGRVKMSFPDIDCDAVEKLYDKIKILEGEGRNGFWVPILKNMFAPVYSEHEFDYVIGNPPWVSWKSMSKSYRDLTLPIWLSYDIFTKNAYDRITTHDDFAMAFVYVSADHYLKDKGKLCFIISQAFFKSKKGGYGFRKFKITTNKNNADLKVEKVADMVKVKPFYPEVSNRTAVMLLKKGEKTEYPVSYEVWKPKPKCRVNQSDTLQEVNEKVQMEMLDAVPIGSLKQKKDWRTPWLTLPKSEFHRLVKAIGKSGYKGRKGVEPLGAKGVYILKEPIEFAGGRLQICNNLGRGRLKKVDEKGEHVGLVEDSFVFPCISGRNMNRYGTNSCSYILLPHTNKHGPHNAVPEEELKLKFTATYEWLDYFRDVLLETRIRNGKFFDESIDPFYALDNVGTYTFSPFKVVWREQNKRMVACVVSSKNDSPCKGKLIIPDSKVLFCSVDTEAEAHYMCAILNSEPISKIIEGYTIETQRGTDILENIKIPKYDLNNGLHKELSDLSIKAHLAYKKQEGFETVEAKINKLVLKLF